MTSLTIHAHAKINLTLDVGARRPDGYHDIRSIMQTIALHDTLTMTLSPETPGVHLEVTGEQAEGVPADAANLVHKAAARGQKIAAALGLLPGNRSGLHICLHKSIPAQAGLGGGSSDAAAALQAVNSLFALNLSFRRLAEIGAALGADVPFFLAGGTALVEGLGEEITPLPLLAPPWPLVIVKPPLGVSTAAAYAALDAVPQRQSGTATSDWLQGKQTVSNDFETVILRDFPEVALAHAALHWTGERRESFRPLLCGSGAAVFCRARSPEAAGQLAEKMKKKGWRSVWVTETLGTPE